MTFEEWTWTLYTERLQCINYLSTVEEQLLAADVKVKPKFNMYTGVNLQNLNLTIVITVEKQWLSTDAKFQERLNTGFNLASVNLQK